jgi:sugar lactone lactonase YvrE
MIDFEVLASGYRFVEAPRLAADGTLYFSDMSDGGVHRRKIDGTIDVVIPERGHVGGIALNADGRIVCSGSSLILCDPVTGATTDLLTAIDGEPLFGINDIEAAPDGGLFGGTMDFVSVSEKKTPLRPGRFFHLAPDGQVTVFRDDVYASNGLGYSPDGRTLYHSETTTGVWAWDIDDDGMPTNPRLFIPLDDSDGLAVDAEGGIWVARWQASQIVRHLPDGSVDRRIDLPFPYSVSIDFGGPDQSWLYVSTGGGEGEKMGGVIRFDAGVRGLPRRETRFSCT